MSRKLILGTDWYTDCDDVVAARVVSEFVKSGEIDLLGVVSNTKIENTLASIDAFFINEGLYGLPIGISALPLASGNHAYQERMVKTGLSCRTNADAEDGVKLYRRLLAGSDEKVDMLEIGFHNAVEGLLKSGPDEYSPLSGIELVAAKVSHLWVMAGKWDVDGGWEYNVLHTEDSAIASAYLCENFPSPITFLGFEVGEKVLTGSHLPKGDMLREALSDHARACHYDDKGRSSWDPMTALLACIGNEDMAGYDVVRGKAVIDIKGQKCHFIKDDNGSHCYVVKKYPDSYYAKLIDAIIAK